MKRYRILSFDFDTRVMSLEDPSAQWDDNAKKAHEDRRARTIEGLSLEFGAQHLGAKVENFAALGHKPLSVLAFHNKFLEQARNSFVIGGYYPALTGACALGERILNRMVLLMRDHHKSSPEYKKLYRKDSIDYWPAAIDALESWGELLPEAADKFRELNQQRNRAIHFNPEVDLNDRELALEAIHVMQDIVSIQFSAFGSQPWYFCIPGEIYVRKDWEEKPFVKHVVIPSGFPVGPHHEIKAIIPQLLIADPATGHDPEITDEEFIEMRSGFRGE